MGEKNWGSILEIKVGSGFMWSWVNEIDKNIKYLVEIRLVFFLV